METSLTVTTPELSYLPGLFLPSPERAIRLAILRAEVAVDSRQYSLDEGDDALRAQAKAQQLHEAGWERVTLAHGEELHEETALVVLERALAEQGIETVRRCIPRGDEEPLWLDEREQLHTTATRSSAMRALVRIDPDGVSALEPARGKVWALRLPPPPLEPAARRGLMKALEELVRRIGNEPIRFLQLHVKGEEKGRRPGSSLAWAARYGLDDPGLRSFLIDAVRRCFPEHFGTLHTVLGHYHQAVDPLEEMYAGNGLPDRNAELLVETT